MGQQPTLHLLNTCPFCWKVRGVIEHLNLDVKHVPVNGMRLKKELAFAGDWGKVPVYTTSTGEHVVDSTPLMKHLDEHHNNGQLSRNLEDERSQTWLNWADNTLSSRQ